MGTAHEISNRPHMVFHVGKELPEMGSDFVLVPGLQNAQGRGVYFSEVPMLKYTGGEHFKANLSRAPIFTVPLYESWQKNKNKLRTPDGNSLKNRQQENRDPLITYHTEGRGILFRGIIALDAKYNGEPVRYYTARDISFFEEPKTNIYDEVYGAIRKGLIPAKDLVEFLRHRSINLDTIPYDFIARAMAEAAETRRIPPELAMIFDKGEGQEDRFEFSNAHFL